MRLKKWTNLCLTVVDSTDPLQYKTVYRATLQYRTEDPNAFTPPQWIMPDLTDTMHRYLGRTDFVLVDRVEKSHNKTTNEMEYIVKVKYKGDN